MADIGDLQPGEYGIPKARNFAVADAVVLPNRLYQMTVSPTHPIKGVHMKQFTKAFTTVDLYFVVPESLFGSFDTQKYVTNHGKDFRCAPKHLANVTQCVLSLPL